MQTARRERVSILFSVVCLLIYIFDETLMHFRSCQFVSVVHHFHLF